MKPTERAAPGDFHLAPFLHRLHQPVIVVDEFLRTRYVNEPARRLRTHGRQGSGDETVYDFMPRPQADIVSDQLHGVLNSGKPAEHAIEWPTGCEVHRCSISIVPVIDPADSSRYLVTLIDCPGGSPAGRSDEEYHLATPHLPHLLGEIFANLDTGPFGICLKNLHRFLWVNRTFAETYGLAPQDFIGKPLAAVLSDSRTISDWRAGDEQVLRTGKPLLNLERTLDASVPRRFRVDKFPFIDRHGHVAAVIGVAVEKIQGVESFFHLERAELALQRLEDIAQALEDRHAQEGAPKPAESSEPLLSAMKHISPVLGQLKQTGLPPEENSFVEIIEKNIARLTDPVTAEISAPIFKLSPTEVQIAQLVRDGKTSKEIASLLNLSPSTIHTHRQRIREKLGLKNKAAGLRSHLHSL